ncbi:MAG: hypothetical protein ACLP8S_21615 [Solirubrobacteraceae bacterium]
MSQLILPASCYEEALPDLRAPYLPSQIRPLIIQAPKNDKAPCRIALYTIGETLMDRFNLCCGGNWNVAFRTETHKEIPKQDSDNKPYTVHYFKVSCSVTVFGIEHSDFGEGEGTSEALAEFDARAQAFKRASRWHGPGQCLYVFGGEEFIMWRGPEPGKLQIPKSAKSGDEPHRRPYFDHAGRQAVRDEYDKWLKKEGESQFGIALNHLVVAEAIRERALHRPLMAVPDLSRADLSSSRPEQPSGAAPDADEREMTAAQARRDDGDGAGEGQQAQAGKQPAPAVVVPVRRDVQRLPMPDEPAAQEAVAIAESAGFTTTVAHALSNLARGDAQTGALSERQQKTVVNWLVMLSDLHLTSEEIVQAVQFVASNGTTQEARQATFTRWLSGKASGEKSESQPAAPATPATPADSGGSNAEPSPDVDTGESVEEPAQPAAEDVEPLDTERALRRINVAMEARGYTDQTVTQLAKLAIGVAPKGRLDWSKVPPSTMLVLAELLESASTLDWTPEVLAKEVLAAHNGNQQATPAGRFSAFAGHLINLAESRAADEAA